MEIIRQKTVKIRKPRTCFLCFRNFERGSMMEYWFQRDGCDLFSDYNCIDCQKIANGLPRDEVEDGFESGMFQDYYKGVST